MPNISRNGRSLKALEMVIEDMVDKEEDLLLDRTKAQQRNRNHQLVVRSLPLW